MSAHTEGGSVLIVVTAHATLSVGSAHLTLSAREGTAQGTWRYNLGDSTNSRIQYGCVAGMTSHVDVLRYAAGICKDAYAAETVERELLEQFAEPGEDQP